MEIVPILAFGAFIHMIPSIIAYERKHPDRLPILLVNLFLGWTVIGWVVALVWSVLNRGRVIERVIYMPPPPPRPPPLPRVIDHS